MLAGGWVGCQVLLEVAVPKAVFTLTLSANNVIREKQNIKSRECSRLIEDLNRLNAENKQLKEEINNLKSQVIKLSDKSSFERELQQLKTTNCSLEIDLKEFKASFERERQIRERLEKENEKSSQDAARLKEEKLKIEENLKTRNEELCALKEKGEELKNKCSELEVLCKELEGLKLVLSRKQSLRQEKKSKQHTKTSSDENESNGKDWDWADDVSVAESDAAVAAASNKVAEDKDDLAGLLSDDQLADLVRLGSELKEKMDEINRFKILIKDLMNEKQDLEKSCATLKTENETLTSSLRDANEKSLTLESKIKALKDIYEDQMKDLTKQLTKQQFEKEKQSSAMSNVEDDMNR
uniref:Uncharacterized protein n=1 Tax=Romanomermis culicivorax TaxID=13658 RepID=A0A915I7N5_ROMCU